MDIINSLKGKVDTLNSMDATIELDNIIVHINRANEYFSTGKIENDEHYFTDVIYRCNQAFEGCSRLSYKLFADKDERQLKKAKAHEIEDYLNKNKILNSRVYPLFKSYRENWRNASSHDFNLLFSEDEAFVAISSVVSFAYVLFGQMIIKVAHNLEADKLKNTDKVDTSNFNDSNQFHDSVSKSIREYFMTVGNFENSGRKLKNDYMADGEYKMVGALSAYLESKYGIGKVSTEISLGSTHRYRPDIVIQVGNYKIVIEVKAKRINDNHSAIEQLRRYADVDSAISSGMSIFYFRVSKKMNITYDRTTVKTKNGPFLVERIELN